jgi:hypothetical protein
VGQGVLAWLGRNDVCPQECVLLARSCPLSPNVATCQGELPSLSLRPRWKQVTPYKYYTTIYLAMPTSSGTVQSPRVSLTSSGLLFGASTGDDQATHVFVRIQKVMRQRREKRRRALFAISGVVLIAVALAIGGHIAYFYYRSKTQGDVLISKYKKAIALAKVDPRLCSEKDQGGVSSARPGGLLEIPSLGLVAPVVQGTSQSVLEDAVGHDPASPWPSSKGTSVFDAPVR